jgi:ribosomal protein L16 Arg81 hydroxylase
VYEDLTQHYKAISGRIAAVTPAEIEPAKILQPKIKLGVPPVSDAARQFISSTLLANGMVWSELVRPDRSPDMVVIRAEIYEFLSNRGWSLSQIGNLFKRDHTTVLHSLRKLPEWRAK